MSSNGRFSPYGMPGGMAGTETESYRSMSPPIDERTGMMSIPPMTMRNGQPSPGSSPYDRTGFVGTHEMDNETERYAYPTLPFSLFHFPYPFILPPKILSSHQTNFFFDRFKGAEMMMVAEQSGLLNTVC